MMERPERLICLIAGALLDVMEPALWVLAVLANLTAVQRIVFTRRMIRAEPRRARVLLPLLVAVLLLPADVNASAETERAWARAVAAFQDGQTAPLAQAFAAEAALASPIGDYVRFILADALARDGDVAGARAAALSVADHHPDSRLAPRALVLASVLASRAGDEAGAQAALRRLLERYPDVLEVPEALYLLGQTAAACRRRPVTRPSASRTRRATPASWCARCAWSATRRRGSDATRPVPRRWRPRPGARRPTSSRACASIRRASSSARGRTSAPSRCWPRSPPARRNPRPRKRWRCRRACTTRAAATPTPSPSIARSPGAFRIARWPASRSGDSAGSRGCAASRASPPRSGATWPRCRAGVASACRRSTGARARSRR